MNTRSLKPAGFVLCILLVCAAGCQLADFHGGRSLARNAGSDNGTDRLSDGQIADVQLALARSLEQQGETIRALDAYREAVEANPKRSIPYWRMAVIHDRKGNVGESEALYRQALKIDPKNPDVHCDFGYSLYLQRRWGEAEDYLRQALALKASHRRAHNNLGLLLAQTERTDEALAEFGKSGCEQAEARANLAFVLTLNHRWDEARQQYELALEDNSASVAARTGLDSLENLIAKAAAKAGAVAQAKYESPVDARPASSSPAGRAVRPEHLAMSAAGRAD